MNRCRKDSWAEVGSLSQAQCPVFIPSNLRFSVPGWASPLPDHQRQISQDTARLQKLKLPLCVIFFSSFFLSWKPRILKMLVPVFWYAGSVWSHMWKTVGGGRLSSEVSRSFVCLCVLTHSLTMSLPLWLYKTRSSKECALQGSHCSHQSSWFEARI